MVPRRKLVPALSAALLLVLAAPSAQAAFHFTHKVTVKETITDNWTLTALDNCGLQGPGSMTASFAWVKAAKTTPVRVPSDRWKLIQPFNEHRGTLVRDLDPQLTTGSVTYTNSTTRAGSDCEPPDPRDSSGCGTRQFKLRSNLVGFDLRNLEFDGSPPGPVNCLTGEYSGSGPPFGPGRLLLRMPSRRALARRHTTVLHRTTGGHVSEDIAAGHIDETVTTNVVVTFTRLRR